MSRHKPSPEELLDAYLTRLQKEDAKPSELLELGTESADALGPLLSAAFDARRALRPGDPDARFAANAEVRVLNRMRALRKRVPASQRARPVTFFVRLRTAPVFLGVLIALTVLLGSLGVASASADSLPGDGLYAVKRGIEQARLALTLDASGDAKLLSEFSDERVREIEALAAQGRLEDLDEAVEAYVKSMDTLEEVGGQDPASGGSQGGGALDEKLAQHMEVLQGVQDKVPPQAQAALQRAIDRAQQQAEKKEGQGNAQDADADREQRQAEQEAGRNQRTAEQIARKYGVPPEQVLGVFQTVCELDWKCVRDFYRGGKHEPPRP